MCRIAAIVPLLCMLALAAGPGSAAAGGTPPIVPPTPTPPAVGRTGAELLQNSGAQTGAASAQGWDAVTIPGWRVLRGLPTVVRAGTPGFPAVGAGGGRRNQMFAGGAGGNAVLAQWVTPNVGYAGTTVVRYRLSARLGASATSHAGVSLRLLDAGGELLATRRLRPVHGHARHAAARLRVRALTGRLPFGTARAEVVVHLDTTLANIDGPYAPKVGYDRAVADAVHFTIDRPVVRRPALAPPRSRVPRYRHVFLFYFENQDVDDIVGDRRRAPYYNELLSRGSRLDAMYAEEHPSDGNYLAFAGGSTFGIPLDDPPEENSQYTIHAPNLGDRIDAAGETWKVYDQSAAGPCDDTVHGVHWDDDQPMLFFADVRSRPAYCARHVVPLAALHQDLRHASSTPSFTWIGVNDCDDMEGCGIRAGDRFLAHQLGMIMHSPAWRRQRSLAIITFDEDDVDHERPAQRIPTVVLGSQGVRRGYASHRRYTHYSLLRTLEGALGVSPLTANDRYAQPLNDVFRAAAPGARAPRSPYLRRHGSASVPGKRLRPVAPAAPATPMPTPAPAPAPAPAAFVTSAATRTVTPISLATGRKGTPIPVGRDPSAITLSPDDRTAYVVNSGSDSVTPIDTLTRRAARPIRVGRDPVAIAVTPDGRTAFVSDSGSNLVTPIDLRTRRALAPIAVGAGPHALAVAPDGRTLYVCDWGGAEVTPIDLRTRRALAPIPVGGYPSAIAISPDGRHAEVAGYGADTVTSIALPAGRPARAIPVGQAPGALALTPDGRVAEVVDGDVDAVTPIALATGRAGRPVHVGSSPTDVAATGRTAYVVSSIAGTVTPIDIAHGRAERPISVGRYSYPTRISLAPGGRTAVVLGTYAGTVRLLETRTRRVSPPIRVGGYPGAVAITR